MGAALVLRALPSSRPVTGVSWQLRKGLPQPTKHGEALTERCIEAAAAHWVLFSPQSTKKSLPRRLMLHGWLQAVPRAALGNDLGSFTLGAKENDALR